MYSFTEEELLQYLYKETSIEKTAAIQAAIITNWDVRRQFIMLRSAHQMLEEVKLSPRKQTIDNIMSYAEKGVQELTSHS